MGMRSRNDLERWVRSGIADVDRGWPAPSRIQGTAELVFQMNVLAMHRTVRAREGQV